ncbi:MAG: zinc metalloprotease HtpX [Anaerolineae bacterium]|nr:zinc metalloprotease HtpX [Anaerolineae bacterium]
MTTNNMLKTVALMAALTALLGLIGYWLGGSGGIIFALVFSVLINFGAYWFSDSIALRVNGAREVSHVEQYGLHDSVARLAEQAGIPKPRVYLIESSVPNAFATGRSPGHAAIAVTTGLLNSLKLDELEGVIAHELSHIKNRDTLIATIAATMAGAVTSVASMLRWGLIFGGGRRRDQDAGDVLATLALIILAPIAAIAIQLAISRAREFDADASAAQITRRPLALAQALDKLDAMAQRSRPMNVSPATASLFIVNPLAGQNAQQIIASLFSTHPPIHERINRLEKLADEMV